jgi:hypothetical protein
VPARPSPAPSRGDGHPHTIEVPALGRLRRVEVAVGVEPDESQSLVFRVQDSAPSDALQFPESTMGTAPCVVAVWTAPRKSLGTARRRWPPRCGTRAPIRSIRPALHFRRASAGRRHRAGRGGPVRAPSSRCDARSRRVPGKSCSLIDVPHLVRRSSSEPSPALRCWSTLVPTHMHTPRKQDRFRKLDCDRRGPLTGPRHRPRLHGAWLTHAGDLS